MLSRVAGSLYWMGRYLERAENVTRLLLVTTELSVEFEGLDEKLAQAEWDDLLAAVPPSRAPKLDFSLSEGLAAPYIEALLLDEDNDLSVRHSLTKARENARSIREALTREVFANLNEVFRDVELQRRRGVRDPVRGLETVSKTHRAILTTLGAIEHTLSRDQGWTFMKLGEALERTSRTAMVLRTKLPGLRRGSADVDIPLFYARLRGLLRSVASLENFRRVHGAGLDSEEVLRFLLFDSSAPRSIRCGVARMKNYLDQLPAPSDATDARRIAGRLLARVSYEDEDILGRPDASAFCNDLLHALRSLHDSVSRQYFPV